MPAPQTLVVLSVDTEPSVAGAITHPDRHRPLIDEPVMGMAGGRSQALGFIVETLREHGLRATFFVETAHVRAFGEAPMRRYVDLLMAAGQDVQLHLHPVWTSWRDGRYDPAWRSTDDCAKLPQDRLAELLAEGKALLERWTGQPVVSARAGRFSSSRAVLAASAAAGLPVTSHVCLSAPDRPEPEIARPGGVVRLEGARELPVTCFPDATFGRGDGWRPLQVNAVSAAEMLGSLHALHSTGYPVAMVVMHPFDFLKARDKQYTGLRANRVVQRRFRVLCAHLARYPDRYRVVTIAEAAAELPPALEAPKLPASPARALARAIGNYVNDRFL